MEPTPCCCLLSQDFLNIINLALALFASLVAIGYFLRPRLFYCAFVQKDKWKIKVINKNLLFTIKEIRCEIAVSECRSFDIANTLRLDKSETLMISKYRTTKSDYTFKTQRKIAGIQRTHSNESDPYEINQNSEYKYLRVRLLAPNFLGVKKHYERIFTITEITDQCEPKSQCYHNRK